MHTAPKWRVRKDGGAGGGYRHRQDPRIKNHDKLMMAMAMKGDGKGNVKFSTPKDYEEGMQGISLGLTRKRKIISSIKRKEKQQTNISKCKIKQKGCYYSKRLKP